jgi:type VI secretion system protein ImpF
MPFRLFNWFRESGKNMAANIRVRRSVLDRLLADDAPEGLVMTQTVEQLRDTVARDLEALLNSRAPFDFEELRPLAHARRSVLTYGVRDFVGRSLGNNEDKRYIGASLAQAIEAHEPRLAQVQVQFNERKGAINALSFTIRGLLIVRPSREQVSFDAVLQPSLARFSVAPARFAAAA